MSNFAALNPLSKRALAIPYESPFVCQLPENASGSGSAAVSTLEILPTYQEAGPTWLAATALGSKQVRLTWNVVKNAYSYVVYRATTPLGPFSIRVSGDTTPFFVDTVPVAGQYYYKTTSLEPNFGETLPSSVVSVAAT